MLILLKNRLGLTDQEWQRTFSMALLFLLYAIGLGIGRSATDAFFIKTAGSQNIPYMYIWNAGAMVLMAAFYSAAERRLLRYHFLIILIIGFSGMLAVLRLSLNSGGNSLTPYVLFAFYEVYLLIFQMHFWTYANDLFDPREGKRLFPLIGGAGLFGLFLGGLLVAPLVGLLGTINLFLVWALLILLLLPVAYWTRHAARQEGIVDANKSSRVSAGFGSGTLQRMRELGQNKFVVLLAMINVPLWLVVHTVDFLFLTAMDETFEDQDSLSAFLGTLHALVSLTGIVLQVFLTRWLLQWLGVAGSYAIYSISMTLASGLLLVRSLWDTAAGGIFHLRNLLAVSVRFLDEGILNSIYDSSQQLLFNALPSNMRGQARALINGTVEPLVTAIAGGLLLLWASLEFPAWSIAAMTLALGLIWVGLSLYVRRYYNRALVQHLSSRDPEHLATVISQLSGKAIFSAMNTLLDGLKSDSDETALLSFEYLQKANHPEINQILVENLKYTRKAVGLRIIDYLGSNRVRTSIPYLLKFIHHRDPDIRAHIIRCMRLMQDADIIKKLKYYLEDRNLKIRSEAIQAILSDETRQKPGDPAWKALEAMVNSHYHEAQRTAAQIIHKLRSEKFLGMLLKLSRSHNSDVQKAVIPAMGLVGDESIVPRLIEYLGDPEYAPFATHSIINLGDVVIHALHRELMNTDYSLQSRERLVFCLGEIAYPDTIPILSHMLMEEHIQLEDAAILMLAEIKRRMLKRGHPREEIDYYFNENLRDRLRKIFAALNRKISRDGLYLQTLDGLCEGQQTLLHDAIRRTATHREDLVLSILKILYDNARVHAARASLRSGKRRHIAEALEVIEEIGIEGKALAWTLEFKYSTEGLYSDDLEPENLFMELMVQKQHPWFIACCLHTIGKLRLIVALPLVEMHINNDDILIRNNALIASQKLGQALPPGITKKEVHIMATSMERILFLRSVPIFSDVDGNDLQWINEITREITVGAREIIFKENDLGDALYIIVEGRVQVYRGKDTTLDILGPRDCFGEMSIIDEDPRSASTRADLPTRLLAIEREDFQRLLMARPQISIAMFRTISRRLREQTGRLQPIKH